MAQNYQKKTSDEKQKSSVYDIIVYAMMIIAVIFIIVQTFTGNFVSIGFRVALGAWILIAVSISDFVGPMFSGELKGFGTSQLYRYVFSCVLDAIAYMCVYIFIIFIGDFKEWVHYLYLVAAIVVFAVRALVNRTIGKPQAVDSERTSYGTADTMGAQNEGLYDEEDLSESIELGTFRSRSQTKDEE